MTRFGCCFDASSSSDLEKTGEECSTAKCTKKRHQSRALRRSDTVEANHALASVFVVPAVLSQRALLDEGDYDFEKHHLRHSTTLLDRLQRPASVRNCGEENLSSLGALSWKEDSNGELVNETATSKTSRSPLRPTSLAVGLVNSVPRSFCYAMLRNHSDVCVDGDMSSIFGTCNNGTVRSTSTITTPLSTSAFTDAQQPLQQPPSIINGFDYNEKLNGTLKTNKLKAFRTSANGGSIAKHLRIHKLPQPHRCDVVFKALDEALKECMVVTRRDIDSLRGQLDSSTWPCDGAEETLLEAQKQAKAAERYLKRLAFHGSRIDELRDLYDLQLATIPDGETQPLSSVVKQRQTNHKSFSATGSFKSSLKGLINVLCKLEAELEMLAGTLNIEVKGIAGFARLAPGDVFEVQLKCGAQKWKSKVKIGSDKQQSWEAEVVIFKCLLEDLLEIKVFEHKGFGKSVLLIEKTFDPLQLFRAHPQLITLDLNRNGSLKLSLQSTWNPLDGLLTPLTTANDLIHSSLTLNTGSKSTGSNASSIRGTLKRDPSELKSIATTFNSVADLSMFQNANSRRPPLLQNGRSSCNTLSRNGSSVGSVLITTPPQRVQNERASSPLVSCLKSGLSVPPKSALIVPDADATLDRKAKPAGLAQILRRLKPIVHSSLARFPELIALEETIFTLDALLANHRFSQNGRLNRTDRISMAGCYGTLDRLDCLRLRSQDMDDLDNNILNRPSLSGLRVQFSDLPLNGNSNGNGNIFHKANGDFRRGVLQDFQLPPPSPSSSASSISLFSHDTPNRRRRYLKKGEANGNGDTSQLHHLHDPSLVRGHSTLERPRSTIFESSLINGDSSPVRGATFGISDLDVCLYHHLLHCEMLLQKLVGYGPLHHCEQEALCKLTVETSILAYLTPFAKSTSPLAMPKVTQLLNELDASTEIQDIWLSAAGTGAGGYYLPARELRQELRRSYGHIVQAKYEELVDKVFDKVLHLLTDRSAWDPDTITVFQFVYCFHEKQLVIFVESLAHETWIVETINCRVRTKIQRVMDRLKHVPVPPPPDVLRHIGLVLTDDDADLRALAESYLLNAQGTLRADLVSAYLAFLEHDDPDTRRGACRALAVLNARRCTGALAFISHNDRKAFVREEARLAVLTFGVEGSTALKNSEQQRQSNGEGVMRQVETSSVRF